MRDKITRREWLLLMVPCFSPLVVGYFLRAKHNQKFALVTDRVFLSPLTPQEQQTGFDTKITIVMNTVGHWPDWLTDSNRQFVGWGSNTRAFYMKNAQRKRVEWPKGVVQSRNIPPRYDEAQQCFIAHGLLNLSALPKNLGQFICEIQVDLNDVHTPQSFGIERVSSAKGSLLINPV